MGRNVLRSRATGGGSRLPAAGRAPTVVVPLTAALLMVGPGLAPAAAPAPGAMTEFTVTIFGSDPLGIA
ncbi:MAG TPA: hypothetical protein VKL22_00725, partial [Actinomycetota bacterium]|nr:hypothetical protein [Actinomycetota bacterium]